MSEDVNQVYNIAPRPLSRLSYQIMGLNLIAVLILIAGVFYLDKYKRDLTAAETELLATETKLYASVVSDNAIDEKGIDLDHNRFLILQACRSLCVLSSPNNSRFRAKWNQSHR